MDSKKPLQCDGLLQTWRNPDNSFNHIFLELDLACEPMDYAGILIISDLNHDNAKVFNIKSLWKELPRLIENKEHDVIAYWWHEDDAKKRSRMLSDITTHPLFVG